MVEFKQSIIKSLGGQIEFYPKLKATIFEVTRVKAHICLSRVKASVNRGIDICNKFKTYMGLIETNKGFK